MSQNTATTGSALSANKGVCELPITRARSARIKNTAHCGTGSEYLPRTTDHVTRKVSIPAGPTSSTTVPPAAKLQSAPLLVTPNDYAPFIKANWPRPTAQACQRASFHMQLYRDVVQSGVPNYMKVEREIPSQLNCDAWDRQLRGYADKEICGYLRYGWPVTYTAPHIPRSTPVNHASAIRHPKVIKKFLEKEITMEAILGPFPDLPFTPWTKISS